MAGATKEGLRNRVIEQRIVRAEEVLDHDGNFREHPQMQQAAMSGILAEIGVAGSLLAYYSERNGGQLTLIDGHMRKSMGGEWPCVITDLNDAEADLLIQAYDPVGAVAAVNHRKLDALRQQMEFQDAAVRVAIDSLYPRDYQPGADGGGPVPPGAAPGQTVRDQVNEGMIPEMELQPYEHYDYLLVLARNVMDWNWLIEHLGISRVNGSTDRRYTKIGLGRAIPADKVIQLLREGEEAKFELAQLKQKLDKKAAKA